MPRRASGPSGVFAFVAAVVTLACCSTPYVSPPAPASVRDPASGTKPFSFNNTVTLFNGQLVVTFGAPKTLKAMYEVPGGGSQCPEQPPVSIASFPGPLFAYEIFRAHSATYTVGFEQVSDSGGGIDAYKDPPITNQQTCAFRYAASLEQAHQQH